MIGLDTNVLVRMLVADDPAQTARARGYLAGNCSQSDPAFVSREVILETVWVLESAYEYRRTDVAMAVEKVLQTEELFVEDEDLVRSANATYRTGADFADAIIAAVAAAKGCLVTATFDRAAASRIEQFQLI